MESEVIVLHWGEMIRRLAVESKTRTLVGVDEHWLRVATTSTTVGDPFPLLHDLVARLLVVAVSGGATDSEDKPETNLQIDLVLAT